MAVCVQIDHHEFQRMVIFEVVEIACRMRSGGCSIVSCFEPIAGCEEGGGGVRLEVGPNKKKILTEAGILTPCAWLLVVDETPPCLFLYELHCRATPSLA